MKKEATKKTQVCLLGVHLKRHYYVFRNTNTNEIARRLLDAFSDVRTVRLTSKCNGWAPSFIRMIM
jgi:hypothetical protein